MPFIQDIPEVRFVPELVVVGTDPDTGLLIQGFELYYGIDGTLEMADYQDGPLGMISVQVLLETLPVSLWKRNSSYTKPYIYTCN